MTFQVIALDAGTFAHLFGKSNAELAKLGAEACIADASPGYPCRISLCDADPGDRLILLNYVHQPADTPYRSSHAIFIRDGAETARPGPGEVPALLTSRLLSVRAFNRRHSMVDAGVVAGKAAANCFTDYLSRAEVAYLHVHTAARGCYLARVERAQ